VRPSRRTLAVAFAACLVLLGLPDGTLGVAWPDLRDTFDRPLSDLAVLSIGITAGYLAAGGTAGRLAVRWGAGPVLIGAAGCTTVGFALFASSPAWAVVVAASCLAGAGGGAMDTTLNAYLALHHGVRAMNLFHGFYGIGATGGPLLAALAVAGFGTWRAAYAILASAAAGVAVAAMAVRSEWRPLPRSAVLTDAAGGGRPRMLDAPLVLAVGLFLVYVAAEVSAGQWSYSLLVEERGTSDAGAAAWVASYWGALTVGRLAVAAVGRDVDADALLRRSFIGALAGSALLWADPAGLGAAGLPLLGFSLAAVFPTLVSLTPGRLGADRATVAMGYQIVAAGIGGLLGPALVGALTAAVGLEVLGPALVGWVAALMVLHAAAVRTSAVER
jgi:fucose permease